MTTGLCEKKCNVVKNKLIPGDRAQFKIAPPHPGEQRLPRFCREKTILRSLLIYNKDANATIFSSFRDKNLMHDQVRQINMFSTVFLFKISSQKKEQLATWLIDDRLDTSTQKSILFHQI